MGYTAYIKRKHNWRRARIQLRIIIYNLGTKRTRVLDVHALMEEVSVHAALAGYLLWNSIVRYWQVSQYRIDTSIILVFVLVIAGAHWQLRIFGRRCYSFPLADEKGGGGQSECTPRNKEQGENCVSVKDPQKHHNLSISWLVKKAEMLFYFLFISINDDCCVVNKKYNFVSSTIQTTGFYSCHCFFLRLALLKSNKM